MPHTALRRHRLDKGLNQTQVARLVGLSQARISMYENGDGYPLDPDVQRALRNLFKVPVPALFAVENTNGAAVDDSDAA